MDYESLIKILKRKKNYFDIDNPFKPKLLFKNRKFQDDYFSVTCFKLFVERNYLKITENKLKVAEDLNNLLQKYEVKTVGTKGTMDIDVKDTKEESPEEEDEDLEPGKYKIYFHLDLCNFTNLFFIYFFLLYLFKAYYPLAL